MKRSFVSFPAAALGTLLLFTAGVGHVSALEERSQGSSHHSDGRRERIERAERSISGQRTFPAGKSLRWGKLDKNGEHTAAKRNSGSRRGSVELRSGKDRKRGTRRDHMSGRNGRTFTEKNLDRVGSGRTGRGSHARRSKSSHSRSKAKKHHRNRSRAAGHKRNRQYPSFKQFPAYPPPQVHRGKHRYYVPRHAQRAPYRHRRRDPDWKAWRPEPGWHSVRVYPRRYGWVVPRARRGCRPHHPKKRVCRPRKKPANLAEVIMGVRTIIGLINTIGCALAPPPELPPPPPPLPPPLLPWR